MKLTTTTLFLLSAIITTSHLLSTVAGQRNLILDTNNKPLETSAFYYIVPAKANGNGGVVLHEGLTETCQVSVVQASFDSSPGLPLQFSAGVSPITQGVSLGISFRASPSCAPSPSWAVVQGLAGGPFIKLDGVYHDTIEGKFQIEPKGTKPAEDGYIIKYCSAGECPYKIGVFPDSNGISQLVATKTPEKEFAFKFQKTASGRLHHREYGYQLENVDDA